MNRQFLALAILVLAGSAHAACPNNAASGIIVVATDTGTLAVLDKCDPARPLSTFRAYATVAGVHVAAGDVTGDGFDDIVTAAGPGGGPHVRVFSVQGNLQFELTPFPGFMGGVRVAVGDVNGDGTPDIITAAGPGGGLNAPVVRVFDGFTHNPLLDLPLDRTLFPGGVYVATADVSGDGFADIIVSSAQGGGPHVQIFDSQGTQMRTFLAYGPNFTGGVRVAAGDITGDGVADIITGAGVGGGPHVRVFNGVTTAEVASFIAFDPNFTGGIYVAGVSDAGGAVTVTAGASTGGIATVRIFGPDAHVQWLMPFPGYKGGLTVAVSPGPMSGTPARSKLPGGLKITKTWP